jgi:hypothetical protein
VNTLAIADIEMKPHPTVNGRHGVVQFTNGWGASIVTGEWSYSAPGKPWEIAVIDADGEIRYDSGLTFDVFGFLTDDEATKVLADIEALTPEVKL